MNNSKNLKELTSSELMTISGGDPGDAAYWIGRGYVWTTAHILTFGMSTVYLAAKELS